jgi:STAS domain
LAAAQEQPLGPNNQMVVVCDVRALDRPDADAVDAVARLALAARRLGCQIRLENASTGLRELLAFVGLGEVIPCAPRSGVESGGHAELRKEPGGVEEERDPADPPV